MYAQLGRQFRINFRSLFGMNDPSTLYLWTSVTSGLFSDR